MREAIGARIRSVRISRGMDRKMLAEMAGCTSPYLAEIEGGGHDPSLSLLRRLSLGLRVPAIELLGGVDGDHHDRLEAYLAGAGDWSADEMHSLKQDIEALIRLYQEKQRGQRACLKARFPEQPEPGFPREVQEDQDHAPGPGMRMGCRDRQQEVILAGHAHHGVVQEDHIKLPSEPQ